MKGILFNLLERVVTETHGEDAWEDVLDAAGSTGAYTAVGNYTDKEFLALVSQAASLGGVTPDDLLRDFGRRSFPLLAEGYPHFFEGHDETLGFLLTLNDIIHVEVRKLYPGAETPFFEYDSDAPDALRMSYHSTRDMCALAEGFVLGAAAHFDERIEVEQTRCSKKGDDSCLFVLSFRKERLAAGPGVAG